jgi:hypothetical protein
MYVHPFVDLLVRNIVACATLVSQVCRQRDFFLLRVNYYYFNTLMVFCVHCEGFDHHCRKQRPQIRLGCSHAIRFEKSIPLPPLLLRT